MNTKQNISGLTFSGKIEGRGLEILSEPACAFLSELVKNFSEGRNALLETRRAKQKEIDEGNLPDFRADTKSIREDDWRIAELPVDLQDRRVEITGPPDRKMVINALNAPVKAFMADFEDALSQTWDNICLLYTSPSPRDQRGSRMPSSA